VFRETGPSTGEPKLQPAFPLFPPISTMSFPVRKWNSPGQGVCWGRMSAANSTCPAPQASSAGPRGAVPLPLAVPPGAGLAFACTWLWFCCPFLGGFPAPSGPAACSRKRQHPPPPGDPEPQRPAPAGMKCRSRRRISQPIAQSLALRWNFLPSRASNSLFFHAYLRPRHIRNQATRVARVKPAQMVEKAPSRKASFGELKVAAAHSPVLAIGLIGSRCPRLNNQVVLQ